MMSEISSQKNSKIHIDIGWKTSEIGISSRQLWWGQQIPAYYYGDGENDFVVAENIEDALKLRSRKTSDFGLLNFGLESRRGRSRHWFSSWLWSMSVFDGGLNPENEDIKYYYPTSDLVTGSGDIIFFRGKNDYGWIRISMKFLSKCLFYRNCKVINKDEKCLNHSEILQIQ